MADSNWGLGWFGCHGLPPGVQFSAFSLLSVFVAVLGLLLAGPVLLRAIWNCSLSGP